MKKVTTREQLSSKLSCVTLFRETLFNGSLIIEEKAYIPEKQQ